LSFRLKLSSVPSSVAAGRSFLGSRVGLDLALILALTSFCAFISFGALLPRHALYWDDWGLYEIFRDELQALNRFGEIGWWFPHKQMGWPAYYYAALGDLLCINPPFLIYAAGSWALGRIGIIFDSYYDLFLFHIAFVSPLLNSIAVYAASRQVFKRAATVRYCLILSAFSPGVMLNLSDVGFSEPTAYGLFFVAAFLYFLRRPSRRSAWLIGLAGCVVGLTINFPALVANAMLPPMLLAAIVIPRSGRRRLWRGMRRVPARQWLLMIACAAICAAAPLAIFSQGRGIVRSRVGTATYSFGQLAPGNPLEVLTASVPTFGMSWHGEFRCVSEVSLNLAYFGYTYLGGNFCFSSSSPSPSSPWPPPARS
jgi:hypothetical protein